MSTLNADLKHLDVLKAREADLKAQAADAVRIRAQWEQHCFDRMVDEEYDPNDSSTTINGVTYGPTRLSFATVQDQEEFVKWAADNDASLLEPKPAEGRLNQLVREKEDNNEPLPPGLGSYTKERISMRGGTATAGRRKK